VGLDAYIGCVCFYFSLGEVWQAKLDKELHELDSIPDAKKLSFLFNAIQYLSLLLRHCNKTKQMPRSAFFKKKIIYFI
jgi:hypothetical protein